jgi:hypothetical protein
MQPTSWFKQPIVWFFAIGGVLFAVYAMRPDPDITRVVVDERVERALVEAFVVRERREPTDAERDGAVAEFIREEVLVREALRRNLHHSDPVVRRRIVQSLAFLLEDAAIAPPTDAQLEAFFDAHTEAFVTPAVISFHHVFVAGLDADAEARATALRQRLDAGEPARGLGDPYPDGSAIGPLEAARITAAFGEPFATSLNDCADRAWCGPLRSALGWHVVRVNERRGAITPQWQDVRHQLVDAWTTEQSAAHREAAIQALIDDAEVVR